MFKNIIAIKYVDISEVPLSMNETLPSFRLHLSEKGREFCAKFEEVYEPLMQ